MTHIETERRWLVHLPLSTEAETEITDDPDVPTRIQQTYLRSDDDTVKRVRFVEYDIWGVKHRPHFVQTNKRMIEAGINEEDEHDLTEADYQLALLDRDPDLITIYKTRYHIHHDGHLLELDVYERDWEGLAILELECDDLKGKVELPPYLEIDREITYEKGWSNYDLSGRYSAPQDAWFGQPSAPERIGWFGRVIDWFRSKPIEYGRNERLP